MSRKRRRKSNSGSKKKKQNNYNNDRNAIVDIAERIKHGEASGDLIRYISVDPGTRYVGWSIYDISYDKNHIRRGVSVGSLFDTEYTLPKLYLYEYGLIDVSSYKSYPDRLLLIYNEFVKLLDEFRPELGVFEEIFYRLNFVSTAKMLQIKGIMYLGCFQHDMDVFSFSPALVKKRVASNGKASKSVVARKVSATLGLNFKDERDDITDALAVGLCYFYYVMDYIRYGKTS